MRQERGMFDRVFLDGGIHVGGKQARGCGTEF